MTTSGDTYTGESNEEILYDGPAPDSEVETKAIDTNEARNERGPTYRLASNSRQDGSLAFDKGLASLRSRSLTDALESFNAAVAAEPSNAMYHYFKALTLFELHGADAAGDVLRQAVELERSDRIANWGKRMERVQGRGRAWIEKARREGGLTR
jgi:tetratricopeptide (TPR) repeat protein